MDEVELLPRDLVLWQNYQYNIIAIGETLAFIGFMHTGTDGSKVFITSYAPVSQLVLLKKYVPQSVLPKSDE